MLTFLIDCTLPWWLYGVIVMVLGDAAVITDPIRVTMAVGGRQAANTISSLALFAQVSD